MYEGRGNAVWVLAPLPELSSELLLARFAQNVRYGWRLRCRPGASHLKVGGYRTQLLVRRALDRIAEAGTELVGGGVGG